MSDRRPPVLVVDDQPGLADLYAAWIEEQYPARAVYGGSEALSVLDESVDVVTLDREMPDVAGDEVLEEIRDRGLDCRVAMVTAVRPALDDLEMGFDAYLTKPVSQDDLLDLVRTLLQYQEFDSETRELLALLSRRATVRAEVPDERIEESDAYQSLDERIRDVAADVGEPDAVTDLHQVGPLFGRTDGGEAEER